LRACGTESLISRVGNDLQNFCRYICVPMPPANQISVIIPHFNQPAFLTRCLASLGAQTGDVPPHEVIVVDNGSREVPHDVVAAFPGVRLIQETTPGPGPARNAGVAEATGGILAFIDADCLADPGWLARIAGHFVANPDHGILGGDVYIAREDPDRATLLEAYESVYAYRMREYIAKQGFTGTGNLGVRADVMAAVGPFGGKEIAEDRDWGQRGTAQGHATHYVADMIVYHPARRTMAELQAKWDRHTAHDFERMAAQGGLWRLRWLIRTGAVAVSPVPEILRIARSGRISGLRERGLAFWGLLRIRAYRARIMARLVFARNAHALSGAWNRD